MSEEPDLNAQMEAKSKAKKEKIQKLRSLNTRIAILQQELAASMPKEERGPSSPRRLKESIDKLEFSIATSAYTLAQEKELIRKVGILKKELAIAVKSDEKWDAARKIRDELRGKRDERTAIRKELDGLSRELDGIYQKIIAHGTAEVRERKEGQARREERQAQREEYKARVQQREKGRQEKEAYKKEMAPYMKELDSFVSLEDIAEVKKKR